MNALALKHIKTCQELVKGDKKAIAAFQEEMKGRSYGYEETLDAWGWFLAGWERMKKVSK